MRQRRERGRKALRHAQGAQGTKRGGNDEGVAIGGEREQRRAVDGIFKLRQRVGGGAARFFLHIAQQRQQCRDHRRFLETFGRLGGVGAHQRIAIGQRANQQRRDVIDVAV